MSEDFNPFGHRDSLNAHALIDNCIIADFRIMNRGIIAHSHPISDIRGSVYRRSFSDEDFIS